MRIKRFEAPDTKTALTMVKKEMGEDAVILSSKRLSTTTDGGGRGWLEVVAAMDFDPETFSSFRPGSGNIGRHKATDTAGPPLAGNHSTFWTAPGAHRMDEGPSMMPNPLPNPETVHPSSSEPTLSEEASNLRKRLAGFFSSPRPAKEPNPQVTSQRAGQDMKKAAAQDISRWRDQLVDQIKVMPLNIAGQNKGPAILALIGATGVGKTTTAAKIAAWFSLHENRKVSLFTMDCYRIGATDQLRTYAKIMRMPCEVILKKEDLQRTVARHEQQDIIIIDTAGKSPYDQNHIDELSDAFSRCQRVQPLLVLSATTKKEDLAATISAYRRLPLHGLALTKLDETRAYAYLCQQVVASTLPVTSLCTGQRVPEDFFVASKNILSTLFKQGWTAFAGENLSLETSVNC